MLPAILRMIVPAVSDDREHAAPRAGNPLPGVSLWGRRSRGRRVSGGCGAGCAALAGRSPHDAPPTPVHPPATCRVVARADRSPCSPGSLRNGVELPCGVDEHGAEDALPGAGSRYRRPANRRARSTPRHAACSGSRGSALALVWVERHDHPRPLAGGHRLPGVSRAGDAIRSTRRQAHHLVATVDVRLQPAPVRRAIPESGGLLRPKDVVNGRDAPSRPGRKAHNCNLSGGTDGVSPSGP